MLISKNAPKILAFICIVLAVVLVTLIALVTNNKSHAVQNSEELSEYVEPTNEGPLAYTANDIPRLLEEAREQHDLGNYQNAIDIYAEVIKLDPKNLDALSRTAHTYRYWYKYDKSEEWFLKSIEVAPDEPYLWADLGKLYRNMGEYDKAEETFKKGIEINPTFYLYYGYGLGYVYLEQDRYDEAEEMFLKALELAPDQDSSYMNIGDFYREVEKFDKAEEMFKKALELNPQSESYYGLGLMYEAQERYKEAAEAYLAYFKNIREKAEVYNALARVYKYSGKLHEARDAVARAIELNPGNPIFVETKKWIEIPDAQ